MGIVAAQQAGGAAERGEARVRRSAAERGEADDRRAAAQVSLFLATSLRYESL
jgi:hypothetical protein